MNVLVVDNNEAIHYILEAMLKTLEVTQIFYAYNGCEILNCLWDQELDLIFYDIQIPMMGSMEFFETICQKLSYYQAKIIFMSDFVSGDIESFMNKKGFSFLPKPFGTREIKGVLD